MGGKEEEEEEEEEEGGGANGFSKWRRRNSGVDGVAGELQLPAAINIACVGTNPQQLTPSRSSPSASGWSGGSCHVIPTCVCVCVYPHTHTHR